MIKSEFQRLKKDLKQGDKCTIAVRGNYGNSIHEGKFLKAENDRIYLDNGFSHHYKRIISMSHILEENAST